MDRIYLLCYQLANELDDIVLFSDKSKALDALAKHKKSHQILEYELKEGRSDNPVFAYLYLNDELKKLEL